MNLTTRRRAIYTGLSSHFAGDELLAAVALWECKYFVTPSYALDGFIAELVASTDRTIERAAVYRDLMGALTGPAADLLPDPERLINVWRGSNQNEPSVALCRGDVLRSFETLVAKLFIDMDVGQVRLLRGFVKGNLNVLTGSNEQRMLMRNWLEQGLSLEEAQLSTSQLRQLLNLLYVGMGEYLGPEEADWRLSQAVKQSESAALVLAPDWLS